MEPNAAIENYLDDRNQGQSLSDYVDSLNIHPSMDTDFSSGSMSLNYNAPGDAWRGIGSSWFNKNSVAREDWLRGEVSADNAFKRQLYADREAREWSERMASTQYQRAMADMKKAGLNPILAYDQGGSSVAPASGGSGSSNYRGSSDTDPAVGVLKLIAGLIATAVTKNPAAGKAVSSTIDKFDSKGNLISRTISTKK